VRPSLHGRCSFLLFLVSILSEPCAAQEAGDWTQFRFDAAHSGFNHVSLSASNVAGLKRRWTTVVGQTVFASAAVVEGRVYVGTLDGRLRALDAETGAHLWSHPDDALTGDAVWTSPAVASGIVYFAANRPDLAVIYAVDAATGAEIWTAAPSLSILVASPAVAEGVVYFAFNDHSVKALDAATGAQIWTADAGGGMYASPAVADGRVFVSVHNRGLVALDSSDGHELWIGPMPGPQWSSPSVVGGRVFVGSRDDQRVYAFDASSGATLWTATTGGWVQSSPAVAFGKVYVGSNDGKLYALDESSGGVVWSTPLAPTGGIFAGPTVANQVVYATSGQGDGRLYAVDARTGTILKRALVGDGDQTGDGEWVNASPTVANSTVYVGSYESGDSVIVAFGLPER
jgi:outer membrane protein assembly factor BamB